MPYKTNVLNDKIFADYGFQFLGCFARAKSLRNRQLTSLPMNCVYLVALFNGNLSLFCILFPTISMLQAHTSITIQYSCPIILHISN